MNRRRPIVVAALVAGIVSTGCESARNPHDHGGAMVGEYRPAWKPVERRSAGSAVYVLWRWEPVPPVAWLLYGNAADPTNRSWGGQFIRAWDRAQNDPRPPTDNGGGNGRRDSANVRSRNCNSSLAGGGGAAV